MIFFAELSKITNLILFKKSIALSGDDNYEADTYIWPYYVVARTLQLTLVSIAHWIFSMQYLEVVLMLSLLMNPSQTDHQKKQKKFQWIIRAINLYFFIQVTVWTSFMLANIAHEYLDSYHKILQYDAANKLMPAFLLIVSIIIFRS